MRPGLDRVDRAAHVRGERRDLELRQRSGERHDLTGVGHLRQEFCGHERPDLDLAHAGGMLGGDPAAFLRGRHDHIEVLQPVARPDLDDLDIDIVHRLLQSEAPGLLYAAGARVPA